MGEDQRMDLIELVTAASRVLSEHFGREISLRWHETLRARPGNTVVRVRALRPREDAGMNFVVKAGPRSVPHAEEMLWNDWAALQFIGGLQLDPPVCPRLFGGDRSTPFIVMEDLGADSVGPAELLEGSDPGAAAAALAAYVKCLGRLHSATLEKAAEFRVLRDSFSAPTAPKPLYHDPWSHCEERDQADVGRAIQDYIAVFQALGLAPHRGVAAEIEAVTRTVESGAGPYAALCQGDQNGPGGCLYSATGDRLIDFGACGFRHALIEGMPHRMTWGCTKQIPRRLYSWLDKCYQSALAQGCRDAADDRLFRTAMMNAAARWNIFHTVWRVPDALQGDRPRGLTSLRQQVIAWLGAFSDMTEEFSQMTALGDSVRRLLSRLKALWPWETHTIPHYSAFRNP